MRVIQSPGRNELLRRDFSASLVITTTTYRCMPNLAWSDLIWHGLTQNGQVNTFSIQTLSCIHIHFSVECRNLSKLLYFHQILLWEISMDSL